MNRRRFLGTLVGLAVAPVARGYIFDGTNWKVYKCPRPNSSPVLGFKGSQFMETGIVYAPYIPLVVTEKIAPDDIVLRRRRSLTTKMQFL